MKYKSTYDYITYGIISGLVGGIIMMILIRPMVWLYVIDKGIIEYVEMIVFGSEKRGFLPHVIGTIGHLLASSIWGIMYSSLYRISPGHRHLKGFGMGILLWFAIDAFLMVVRIIHNEEVRDSLILISGSALFGLAMSTTHYLLVRKHKI